MKELLQEGDNFSNDDIPTIFLPDTTKEEMSFLLSILYSGSLNIYKRLVDDLFCIILELNYYYQNDKRSNNIRVSLVFAVS